MKIILLSKCRITRTLCFPHFKLDYPACNMAAPLRGPYQYGDSPCRPHLTQGQTPGPWDRTVQMEWSKWSVSVSLDLSVISPQEDSSVYIDNFPITRYTVRIEKKKDLESWLGKKKLKI